MTALLIVNLACDGFRRLGLSDGIDCHCSTDRVQIRVLIPVAMMSIMSMMVIIIMIMIMVTIKMLIKIMEICLSTVL